MALQALTEYAKQDTNRALYNIEVNMEATSIGNFTRRVRLDRSNWQVQQLVNVCDLYTTYITTTTTTIKY